MSKQLSDRFPIRSWTPCLYLFFIGVLGFSSLACSFNPAESEAATSSTLPTLASTTLPTTTTVPTPPIPPTTEELLSRVRNSVVRIRNTGCGELSTGTAWLAPDGRLLSNRHVVEAARTLDVLTWDGIDATATSAQTSDSVDVGVLGGEWGLVQGLQSLPVRTERVAPGDRVAIVGYPEGQELAISTGVAVGYELDTEIGTVELLKATTVVKPGNSGGPALDDQGRVIGMVFAELIAADEALIIPWDVIAALTPADFETDLGCS